MTRHIGMPNWVSYFGYRKARKAAAEIRAVLDPIVARRYDAWHRGEREDHGDILQSLISTR